MIDYATRKAVARWCRDVALEDVGTVNHAERVNIARNLVTAIYRPSGDDEILNVVMLVRAFVGDDATTVEIEAALDQIFGVYVKLGVLQG